MSMNFFRLCGDGAHQLAICLLLYQLIWKEDGRGISLKTQEIFLLLSVARYLDLFTLFYSLYNSVAKVFYITASLWIVKSLRFPSRRMRHEQEDDIVPHCCGLILPSLILAILCGYFGSAWYSYSYSLDGVSLLEVLWTYSIIQETTAMIPQLVFMHRNRDWGPIVAKYVFLMWLYRLMYIFNWVYRSYKEPMYQHHYLVYTCGVLQSLTVPYAWFVYLRHPRPLLEEEEQDVRDSEEMAYSLLDIIEDGEGENSGSVEMERNVEATDVHSSSEGGIESPWWVRRDLELTKEIATGSVDDK
mmetsp:Transcript_17062/g.37012  ORF Transcript_17062/g.37012 Transcript_17062/m.37012 type:complete len:301 (-) Transcript_17062:37-939(-)